MSQPVQLAHIATRGKGFIAYVEIRGEGWAVGAPTRLAGLL
jgi:hypothetical protein